MKLTTEERIKQLERNLRAYEILTEEVINNTQISEKEASRLKHCICEELGFNLTLLNEAKAERNVEIIKPYLESKGYDFTIKNENDRIAFKTRASGNIIHLQFYIERFVRYDPGADVYKVDTGQIVYDEDGNILIDLIKNADCKMGSHHPGKIVYSCGDPSKTFIDENNILIEEERKYCIPTYTHYRRIDDKLICAHNFSNKDTKLPKRFTYLRILNIKSEHKLAVFNGRIYDFTEGKFVNDLEFGDIQDYKNLYNPVLAQTTILNDGKLDKVATDKIKELLRNNNYLYATRNLWCARVDNKDVYVDVFCYIDANCNIVGKLFYYIGKDLHSKDVTNETFNDVLDQIKNELADDAIKKFEIKKENAGKAQKNKEKQEQVMMSNLSQFTDNLLISQESNTRKR